MKRRVMAVVCGVMMTVLFSSSAYAETKGTLIECETGKVTKVNFYLEREAEEEYYSTYAVDGEITSEIDVMSEAMTVYINDVNKDIDQKVVDMIPDYIIEGKKEGIRGDIAFAMSCLETGNFKFRGSAVSLEQNNFCGLGVTGNGMKGNAFDTPQEGIRAQIQHLKAYANKEPLKTECIDPRFTYVSRGSAPYVEWLGIQENPNNKGWAYGAGYGKKILRILDGIETRIPETDNNGMPDDPEMEGFLFVGWLDEEYQLYSAEYEVTKDLNLYAVWCVDGSVKEADK